MFSKSVVLAGWASLVCASLALAQPSGFAEPAELPPATFKGQQYVDSKGCVFLRAGVDGRVTWVPRVTADRKQLCTGAAVAAEPVAEEPPTTTAPVKAAPVVVAKPATAKPKKVKKTAAVATPPATPKGLRMACPAGTPFLERLISASGDSKLYCTKGDGTIDGAALPRIIDSGKVVGQLSDVTIAPPSQTLPTIPKGYVRAWKDDRLNADRAKPTAAGNAAQDKVWTRTVPLTGVPGDQAVAPIKGAVKTPATAASGRLFIQVGSFAVAGNADGAANRLSSLGLPVARKAGRINGAAVQVVYAGPFGSTSDAHAALSAVRRAGFGDAFMLR
jgi:hypothetical protein